MKTLDLMTMWVLVIIAIFTIICIRLFGGFQTETSSNFQEGVGQVILMQKMK